MNKWKISGLVCISLVVMISGILLYYNDLAIKREEERLNSDEDLDGLTLREEMRLGSDPKKPNPTLFYAYTDRKISINVSTRFIVLDRDGKNELDLNNKALVNYIFNISQVEVISSEVQRLVPEVYKESVVRTLQTAVLYDILADGKVSPEEAKALTYLSSFNPFVQRGRIEHGLDEASLNQLAILSRHPDQQFAQYAVVQKLGIEDHLLSQDELDLLMNPSKENMVQKRDQYLKLLEDTGDPIYIELVKEWKELPEFKDDLTTVETTEDMVSLALSGRPYAKFEDRFDPANITPESEVHEAFELMLKGGTPDPEDFKHIVPVWNTELEILRWLAEQNEFKKHDTLAQATAMVNGVWVSMGDEQVRTAVYDDINDLMNFFMETNEIQKARGYYQLENYPLEAKICLVDRSNANPAMSPSPYRIWQEYMLRDIKLDLLGYEWNTIKVETLYRMREVMDKRGWINKDVNTTISNLELWFYFNVASPNRVGSTNWEFVHWETIPYPVDRGNVDSLFQQFLKTNKGWGSCVEETELLRGFLQSWGITPNTFSWGHLFNYIFDHKTGTWIAYVKQLEVLNWDKTNPSMEDIVSVYFYKPPINQNNFFSPPHVYIDIYKDLNFYYFYGDKSFEEIKQLFIKGIPTSQMKKYVIYNSDDDFDGLTLMEEMRLGSDPTKPNPTLFYAYKDRKIPINVSIRFIVLDRDGKNELDPNNKALVDYIFNISKAEVVSSEVQKLAPEGYRESVIRTLQIEVLDGVLADGKVSLEDVKVLIYLSSFDGPTQRMRIDDGLDEASLKQLVILSTNLDQGFSQDAVMQKLGIEDHLLRQDEIELLISPSTENIVRVRDYYLRIFENTDDSTYIELAEEWKKLPEFGNDLKTVETTEDLAFFILRGKPYVRFEDRFDPEKITPEHEVHEAFELMLKGGTPDPEDFKYQVPAWNTELEVLRWLAEQNEFKKNDTLAQAIAMVNGVWVSIGDDQVRTVIYQDANDLLNFFREINEIQKAIGYYQLKNYPLDPIVILVDRTGKFPNNQVNSIEMGLFNRIIVSIDEYEMSNVSLETLKKAKDYLYNRNLIGKDSTETFSNIEKYFYMTLQYTEVFSPSRSRWRYIYWTEPEAKEVGRGDVDYQFQYFWENGYFRGGCADNAQIVNAFGMSIGIPVNMVYRIDMITGGDHAFPIYYEPISNNWHGYYGDYSLGPPSDYSQPQVINIFRPPVLQNDYFNNWGWDDHRGYVNAGFFTYYEITSFNELLSLLSRNRGIPTSYIRQWLFYFENI